MANDLPKAPFATVADAMNANPWVTYDFAEAYVNGPTNQQRLQQNRTIQAFFEQRRPIKEIVRTLSVSRSTVRKVIRSQATEFKYVRGI